jgi:hypothetical protein
MHRTLLKAHGTSVPPATTPPVALAILHAWVIALTNDPNTKVKTPC